MKKKVLFSLMLIGLVGSSSFLVTRAYFTDKKSAKGNTFTVGTLNLQVGSGSGNTIEPFTISGIGFSDTSGSKTWNVKNTGSIPGLFTANFDNIVDSENGCNDAEKTADTTCDDPGHNQGELGKYIKATFYLNDVKKAETTLTPDNISKINQYWATPANQVILQGGETAVLKMDWEVLPEYGNEIQSDSLKFDVSFSLEQLTK